MRGPNSCSGWQSLEGCGQTSFISYSKSARWWQSARNEFFFREGEDGDALFVLESGEAAVLKSWRGQDRMVQALSVGDCFGEMAVMDHCHRSASVQAKDDCTAIRISSGDLYRVYGQDLKQFTLIQMNMGREVSRRLRDANNRLFRAQMGSSDASVDHIFAA